jgi:hypothetical protein
MTAERTRRGRLADLIDAPGDIAALARELAAQRMTDGLPVIPPTEARVAEMLAHTDRDALDIVGILPPRQGEATVHAIAVNAVMAGLEPRLFPILLAAWDAICDVSFNIASINSTTHPCGVFLLVNGPLAREAGIENGPGCFGPGFPANATLGRAIRLVQLNVAGAWPGTGDRATQGSPAKFAFCSAELEDASVNPWGPYHVRKGFEVDVSTVTVFGGEGPHNIQEHGANTAEGLLLTIAGSMGQAGSNNLFRGGEPLLILGPEHADTIAADGLSIQDIQRFIHERAVYPSSKLDPWFRETYRVRLPAGHEAEADRADLDYPVIDRPEDLHVMVAGGPGKHSAWVSTFGNQTIPVTRVIARADGTPLRTLEA